MRRCSAVFVFFLIGFVYTAKAQQKLMNYCVLNKGDTIGKMNVLQRLSGSELYVSVSSLVNVRVLVNIRISNLEQARYSDGKLVLSSLKRSVNDRVKANTETKAVSDYYLLTDDGDQRKLNQKKIAYSFTMLYYKEPIGINHIYSDNYQKFFTIEQKPNHIYVINLPQGGVNTYYYEDGICTKIDVHSSLFNAQMVLNQ